MNQTSPEEYESILAAMEEVKKDKVFMEDLKFHIIKHQELLESLDPGAESSDDREWRVRKMSEIVKKIKDEDAELLKRLAED
jgi:ADP-heptose:LPS heptosyltransferase